MDEHVDFGRDADAALANRAATLAAALKVAERSPAGTNIVCMLPDTGERYLSTPLFEDIGEEMNADEIASEMQQIIREIVNSEIDA